jgi:hypothetical protein
MQIRSQDYLCRPMKFDSRSLSRQNIAIPVSDYILAEEIVINKLKKVQGQ